MANIRLELPSEDIDFIFAVLTQTPLPYQRVAPVIDRIGQQVQAQGEAAARAQVLAGAPLLDAMQAMTSPEL